MSTKSEMLRKIWDGCDKLRGSMDPSEYKDYILSLLFIKYLSISQQDDMRELYENPEYKLSSLSNYSENTMPYEYLYNNRNNGDTHNGEKKKIGELVNIIIGVLYQDYEISFSDNNSEAKGVDFNDETKIKPKDLVELLGIINDIEISTSNTSDILGDVYEFLMLKFASASGKAKGEFYTPSEVSQIMAELLEIEKKDTPPTVYDPTCGSGSLLLKVHSEAVKMGINNMGVNGQENNHATALLCKMNMVLQGKDGANIENADTIGNPQFIDNNNLRTFDYIVANPPFSKKYWVDDYDTYQDPYDRFSMGMPPQKNGDYAFVQHILKSLKYDGRAIVVVPHGVLFRGASEGRIRTEIIKKNWLEGIIGLPANLFFGTGIPAALLIFNKNKKTEDIFMINADKGFTKNGNKNMLRHQDMHSIISTYKNRNAIDLNSEQYSSYCTFVSKNDIEKNEYNLNISRYIDNQEKEEIHNLWHHQNGGIPSADVEGLDTYWNAFSGLKSALLNTEQHGYSFAVEKKEIRLTVNNNNDFKTLQQDSKNTLQQWKEQHFDILKNLAKNDFYKDKIVEPSQQLLKSYQKYTVFDKYDIYQILLTYWQQTIQDDLYVITDKGWAEACRATQRTKGKDNKGKNVAFSYTPDIEIKSGKTTHYYHSDVLPAKIVIDTYFNTEQNKINALESENDISNNDILEIIQNKGEDSIIDTILNDKEDNIVKKEFSKCFKALPADDDEMKTFIDLKAKMDVIDKNKKQIKGLTTELYTMVLEKYSDLTEAEARDLLINKKWYAHISMDTETYIQSSLQSFVGKLEVIHARYEQTLPRLLKSQSEQQKLVEQDIADILLAMKG